MRAAALALGVHVELIERGLGQQLMILPLVGRHANSVGSDA